MLIKHTDATDLKKILISLIFISVISIAISVISGNEASAQTYYATGTLVSKNLLDPAAHTVASIDYFGYLATTTATTTLKVQFSQDRVSWYNSENEPDGWDILENGYHLETDEAINLFALNWSGPYFYYKILFETSDTSQTPILGGIELYYTPGTAPTVTTQTPSPIYERTAVAQGNITNDGGGYIFERGFEYGLTETPTWSVSQTGEWYPGTSTYSLNVTGLELETTYYIRAYAVNLEGTGYGDWVDFTTASPGYYATGTLTSKNLFSGEEVVIINNFFASSTVPAGTALWVQLSTTSQTWYSADGVQDAWTFVPDGQVKFILYNLNWSGPNFYYKMKFETNEAELSPVLDEIILNYNLFHSPYLKGSIRIKGGVILK